MKTSSNHFATGLSNARLVEAIYVNQSQFIIEASTGFKTWDEESGLIDRTYSRNAIRKALSDVKHIERELKSWYSEDAADDMPLDWYEAAKGTMTIAERRVIALSVIVLESLAGDALAKHIKKNWYNGGGGFDLPGAQVEINVDKIDFRSEKEIIADKLQAKDKLEARRAAAVERLDEMMSHTESSDLLYDIHRYKHEGTASKKKFVWLRYGEFQKLFRNHDKEGVSLGDFKRWVEGKIAMQNASDESKKQWRYSDECQRYVEDAFDFFASVSGGSADAKKTDSRISLVVSDYVQDKHRLLSRWQRDIITDDAIALYESFD